MAAAREDIQWLETASPQDKRKPAGVGCIHDCRHRAFRAVAEGPDDDHYQLIVCADADGCNGNCRGWVVKEKLCGTEFSQRRVAYLVLLPA